jgi:hypothetical protein
MASSSVAILEQLALIDSTTDALLAEARQGTLLDLSDIEQRIQALCKVLPAQRGGGLDKAAVQEEIRVIIGKMDTLVGLLQQQKEALAQDIRATTSGKQAARAYLKATRR